jgi:hypothetical protein
MPVAAEIQNINYLQARNGSQMLRHGVFFGFAVLCAIWLAIAVTMREPPNVTSSRGIRTVYWKRWFTSVKKHCVAVQ